jgi:hypothetical protein
MTSPRIRLSSGGAICLEPDGVVIEDLEDDDRVDALAMALGASGGHLRRVYDFAARFPFEVESGADRVVCTLAPPLYGEILDAEGLHGVLRVIGYVDAELSNVMESECVVVSAAALHGPWEDWTALLQAYETRRATWAADLSAVYPEDVCLELPTTPDGPADDGWDDFAVSLGLSPETVETLVTPHVDAAFGALPAVRARYTALYGLELPSSLASLAALVEALGALPCNPPRCFWVPEPGWERGGAWLDSALGMRPSGLSTWFAPGALDRPTHDAAEVYDEVPAGREGPLDARLDMRYRCDAPQFVTFLGGDSDGLHWGFWYDSPAHFPVVAHNYARDSAETWLDGVVEVPALLRKAIAKATDEAWAELDAEEPAPDDDGEIGYALARWRSLRVVGALLDAVEAIAAPFLADAPPEAGCPWPRTEGNPTGSPALALNPDAGTVPRHAISYHGNGRHPDAGDARRLDGRRPPRTGRWPPGLRTGLGAVSALARRRRHPRGGRRSAAGRVRGPGVPRFRRDLKVHLLHRDLPNVGGAAGRIKASGPGSRPAGARHSTSVRPSRPSAPANKLPR